METTGFRIEQLDQDRLKYLWGEREELHYQILQKVNALEWRKFQAYTEAVTYYMCFWIGKRWTIIEGGVHGNTTVDKISNDMIDKLRQKYIAELTRSEFQVLDKHPELTSWEEFIKFLQDTWR